MQFLVAVLVRHEPLPADRLVGCLIWLALIVFSVGGAQPAPVSAKAARDLGDALVRRGERDPHVLAARRAP